MADAGTLFIVAGVVIAAVIVWVLSTRKAPKLPEGKTVPAKELDTGKTEPKLAAAPAKADASTKGTKKAAAEPAKIETKSEPAATTAAPAKKDAKAEATAEPVKEKAPEVKAEPAPKVEAKAEPALAAKVEAPAAKSEAEPKLEAKPEVKPEAPAAAEPAAKPEPVAAKTAPAKSEPKLPDSAKGAPKAEPVRAPLKSEPKAEAARAPLKSEPKAAAAPVATPAPVPSPAPVPVAAPAASPAPAAVAKAADKPAEKAANVSSQKVEAAKAAAPVEFKKVESVRPALSSHHEIQDSSIPAAADVPLGTPVFEFTTAAARWQPDAAKDSGDAHATLLDQHLFVLAANRNGSKGSAAISALRDAKGSNGWRSVLASKGADSTPTVAAFFPGGSNSVELARIGDGQGYRLRGGTLTRITGDGSAREIERKTVEVDVGDLYILCSAELCRTVPEEEIRELLMLDHDPNNGVRDLLAISGDRAPNADVNVLVVRVDPIGGY